MIVIQLGIYISSASHAKLEQHYKVSINTQVRACPDMTLKGASTYNSNNEPITIDTDVHALMTVSQCSVIAWHAILFVSRSNIPFNHITLTLIQPADARPYECQPALSKVATSTNFASRWLHSG